MKEYTIKLNEVTVKYLLEYLGKDIGWQRSRKRLDLAQRATDTYDMINEQKKAQDEAVNVICNRKIYIKSADDEICSKKYEQTYKDKVFGWLMKQPIGIYDIPKLTNEPDKFIQTVKDFIDLHDAAALGYEVEFSNDYKKVIKKVWKLRKNEV